MAKTKKEKKPIEVPRTWAEVYEMQKVYDEDGTELKPYEPPNGDWENDPFVQEDPDLQEGEPYNYNMFDVGGDLEEGKEKPEET